MSIRNKKTDIRAKWCLKKWNGEQASDIEHGRCVRWKRQWNRETGDGTWWLKKEEQTTVQIINATTRKQEASCSRWQWFWGQYEWPYACWISEWTCFWKLGIEGCHIRNARRTWLWKTKGE